MNVLKRIADDEIPTAKIVDSLSGSLSDVFSIDELIRSLQKTVQQIQTDLSIIVEPGVDTGIVIHLAFMLDGLIKKKRIGNLRNYLFSQKFTVWKWISFEQT